MDIHRTEVTLVLPSDSSLNMFPDNKINAYTVRLARPLIFPGHSHWQVGVQSVTYPARYTRANLKLKDLRLYVKLPSLVKGDEAYRLYAMSGGVRPAGVVYQFLPDDVSATTRQHHLTDNKYLMSWHDLSAQVQLELSEIRVEVIDAAGEPVEFQDGPFVTKIVLRRKK